MSLLMAACSGTRTTLEEPDGPAASDTSATSADVSPDSLPQAPSVPVTLPRISQQPSVGAETAPSGRPAFAAVQVLPALSAAFTEQFAIEDPAAWSAGVQRGLVSLSGCTGSLVSSSGLVVTSATCVDAAQTAEPAERTGTDAEADYFLAPSGSERPLDGLEAYVLVAVEDVSLEVAGILSADTSRSAAQAREIVADRFMRGESGRDVFVHETATGSVFAYAYERVEDVRLVFRPEPALVRFGGSFDAGSFPQFRLDVAFLRLYRNGQPMQTPHHFRWTTTAPRTGAPSYAAGISISETGGEPGATVLVPVVSGGRIGGFSYDATESPALASFYGLYDRYYSHGQEAPWLLPPAWQDVPSGIALEAPVGFAATNELREEVLGGAVLSLNLSYRGTIYDTNHEAVQAAATGRRAVAVPASAVSQALEHVYEAGELLNELENGRQSD